jgi:hypothetical protein
MPSTLKLRVATMKGLKEHRSLLKINDNSNHRERKDIDETRSDQRSRLLKQDSL